jgi:AcrR family transcriptional regulator
MGRPHVAPREWEDDTMPEAGRPLSADARRNREMIIAAAEELFLRDGASASLEEIARRAGVG